MKTPKKWNNGNVLFQYCSKYCSNFNVLKH